MAAQQGVIQTEACGSQWLVSESSRGCRRCASMVAGRSSRVGIGCSAMAEWRVVLRTVAAVGGGWRGSRRPIVIGGTVHLCERWIELQQLIPKTGKSERG